MDTAKAAPRMLAALQAIAALEAATKADHIGALKRARHIAKCALAEIETPDPDEPYWNSEFAEDGYELRHDMGGYYLCTHEEGEFEDEGNPSVGFDGRCHYRSPADALQAFRLGDRP